MIGGRHLGVKDVDARGDGPLAQDRRDGGAVGDLRIAKAYLVNNSWTPDEVGRAARTIVDGDCCGNGRP